MLNTPYISVSHVFLQESKRNRPVLVNPSSVHADLVDHRWCRVSPEPTARVLTSWQLLTVMQPSPAYSRMKGLVRWRRRLSGPGAIPQDAGDHTPHLRGGLGEPDGTGVAFQSCSGKEQVSLSFNLITGGLKKLKPTEGLEKYGEIWRHRKPATLVERLFVFEGK